MAFSTDRLVNLRPKYQTQLAETREWVDVHGVSSRQGYKADSLISALRYEAIAGYVLDGNREYFCSNLAECVRIKIKLFEAKSRGDDIEPHLASLDAYGFIYYAYAAKAPELSRQLADVLRGKTNEERVDSVAVGLVQLLRNDRAEAANAIRQALAATNDVVFCAYTNTLMAIVDRHQARFSERLNGVIEAHQRECRMEFSEIVDTEEELLSLWGIGLANLGIEQGLSVGDLSSNLIPPELLRQ